MSVSWLLLPPFPRNTDYSVTCRGEPNNISNSPVNEEVDNSRGDIRRRTVYSRSSTHFIAKGNWLQPWPRTSGAIASLLHVDPPPRPSRGAISRPTRVGDDLQFLRHDAPAPLVLHAKTSISSGHRPRLRLSKGRHR